MIGSMMPFPGSVDYILFGLGFLRIGFREHRNSLVPATCAEMACRWRSSVALSLVDI